MLPLLPFKRRPAQTMALRDLRRAPLRYLTSRTQLLVQLASLVSTTPNRNRAKNSSHEIIEARAQGWAWIGVLRNAAVGSQFPPPASRRDRVRAGLWL